MIGPNFPNSDALTDDDRSFLSLIGIDIAAGTKRSVADLDRYLELKWREFSLKQFWRHKESDTVYHLTRLIFAATGLGKLALMVCYCPINTNTKSKVEFSRQYDAFMSRFEPVTPRTVWDKQ